jgi:hypothetical protein
MGQKNKKVTPIEVSDKKDKRLIAYNDSLNSFNDYPKLIEWAKKNTPKLTMPEYDRVQPRIVDRYNINFNLAKEKPNWKSSANYIATTKDGKAKAYETYDFKEPVRPVIYKQPAQNNPPVLIKKPQSTIAPQKPTTISSGINTDSVVNYANGPDYNGTYVDKSNYVKPITQSEYYKLPKGAGSDFVAEDSIPNSKMPKLKNGTPSFGSKKMIKKTNLPKLKAGDPWYDANGITTQGTSDANLMGGIGDIAGGVGGLLKNSDASSVGSYAGNIMGETGKYASMGSALGPWGAIGGAVLGAGIGTIGAIGADNAQSAEKRQTLANTNMSNNTSLSNGIDAKYNMRNQTNSRVPGMKNGIPMFNDVYSGITEMNKTSVKYKNMPRIKGGTPAFKSGSYNTGTTNAIVAPEEVTMDGQTGELNQVPGNYNSSNPDTVSANLTQGTSVFSNEKKQIVPGGKSTPAEIMARATKMQKINDRTLNPKEGDMKLSRLDRKTAELNQKNIQSQADKLNQYNMLLNPTPNVGNAPKYAGGTPSSRMTGNVPLKTTIDQYLEPVGGSLIDPQYTSTMPILNRSKGLSSGKQSNVPTNNNSGLNRLKTDTGEAMTALPGGVTVNKLTPYNNLQKDLANTPSTPDTNTTDSTSKFDFGSLSSIGNSLMSLAPMAYNSANSGAEVVSPVYANYMNLSQRYNVAPELAEATKQRQIARYNNSVAGSGTGMSQSFGADLYGRGVEQTSNIYNKAEMANAGFKNDYANKYNHQSELNSNEDRRVYDLNSRNRAASRNFGSKNAEMLSQFGQTQELMRNQKESDKLNSYIFSLYNTAMTKEQRDALTKMLQSR